MLVPSVPSTTCSRVVGALADLGLGPDGARGAADVRACPGLSFCSLAITGSQPRRHRDRAGDQRAARSAARPVDRGVGLPELVHQAAGRRPRAVGHQGEGRRAGGARLPAVARRRPAGRGAGRAGAAAVRGGGAGGRARGHRGVGRVAAAGRGRRASLPANRARRGRVGDRDAAPRPWLRRTTDRPTPSWRGRHEAGRTHRARATCSRAVAGRAPRARDPEWCDLARRRSRRAPRALLLADARAARTPRSASSTSTACGAGPGRRGGWTGIGLDRVLDLVGATRRATSPCTRRRTSTPRACRSTTRVAGFLAWARDGAALAPDARAGRCGSSRRPSSGATRA